MNRYCEVCGMPVEPGQLYCACCGTALKKAESPAPEEVLFRTTGGIAPKKNGATMNYVTMIMCFVTGIGALLLSSEAPNDTMIVFLIAGFAMLFFGVVEVAKIRVKSNAANRITNGSLTIPNYAVEGLAAEQNPNDIDVFVNPVMTRIKIADITSAGASVDKAFLLVHTNGKNYVFATPYAERAGETILRLMRLQRYPGA